MTHAGWHNHQEFQIKSTGIGAAKECEDGRVDIKPKADCLVEHLLCIDVGEEEQATETKCKHTLFLLIRSSIDQVIKPGLHVSLQTVVIPRWEAITIVLSSPSITQTLQRDGP